MVINPLWPQGWYSVWGMEAAYGPLSLQICPGCGVASLSHLPVLCVGISHVQQVEVSLHVRDGRPLTTASLGEIKKPAFRKQKARKVFSKRMYTPKYSSEFARNCIHPKFLGWQYRFPPATMSLSPSFVPAILPRSLPASFLLSLLPSSFPVLPSSHSPSPTFLSCTDPL